MKNSRDTEQQWKSPLAGVWCLGCSIASFFLFPLIGIMVAAVVALFTPMGEMATWCIRGGLIAAITFGPLFLVLGFVIAGKYTRWLCIFWASLVFALFVAMLLV
jgi:positive regulator of sigma E activity